VNEPKCEFITNDASIIQRFQSITPGVIIVDPATATLLGAPVDGEQSVDLMLIHMYTIYMHIISTKLHS
jgi:hypothetical protein